MTAGGNRNPANADTGGDHARVRADFTDQVSLDLAHAQRNGAASSPPGRFWPASYDPGPRRCRPVRPDALSPQPSVALPPHTATRCSPPPRTPHRTHRRNGAATPPDAADRPGRPAPP